MQMPIAVTNVIVFTAALFIDDPNRAHLLSSMLPGSESSVMVTFGLVAVDMVIQTFGFVIVCFTMISHLLAFGTINATLKAEIQGLQTLMYDIPSRAPTMQCRIFLVTCLNYLSQADGMVQFEIHQTRPGPDPTCSALHTVFQPIQCLYYFHL